jgi:sortase (surface protein transpeptidase)
VAVAALALSGLIGLGLALLDRPAAPRSDAGNSAASSSGPSPSPSTTTNPQLSAIRITIPVIGADSSLAPLGVVAGSDTLELPPRVAQAGWYTKSPAPGMRGATIVTGYISDGTAAGPFQNLRNLSVGDDVLVGRSDGETVTFTVSKIATYPQGQFDAGVVYAPTDDPELRVITVGGALHPGDDPENVVVFATMDSIDDTRVIAPTFQPTTAAPSASASPQSPTRTPTPSRPAAPASSAPASSAPAPSSSAVASSGPSSSRAADGMPKSPPKRLRIPAIDVDAAFDQVGLAKDGKSMELPPHPDQAAWYDQSVTPGQTGASILAGYVRSGTGEPGVFADIAKLKAGATLSVERADQTVATFHVTKSAFYPDGKFPADDVYSPSTAPELRLITVGGPVGPKGASGNYVVFATFTGAGG